MMKAKSFSSRRSLANLQPNQQGKSSPTKAIVRSLPSGLQPDGGKKGYSSDGSGAKPNSASGQHSSIKPKHPSRVDFIAINATARANLLPILQRWLPDGRRQGSEFLALNPHRADRRLGSFRINLSTGRWADFATGDKGGDVVSLAAFLFGLDQAEAARRLANMLGMPNG